MNATKMKPIIRIGNREIGGSNPCYIIAEIGINFNGSLDIAKRSIEVAADCGADAVKFQTFKTEEFLVDRNLTHTYTGADNIPVTESQYEMFKRTELPDHWHSLLMDHARRNRVDFFSSVADPDAADLLCYLGAPVLKLASEDLINIRLIEHVARKKVPVILSTGMADISEIDLAVSVFADAGHRELTLLHCVSAYPAPPEQCNLKRIVSLAGRFPFPTGFSDHTAGNAAATAAVALGASVLEKHFTLDRSLPGPDHMMSANPPEFKRLVELVRLTEQMMGSGSLDYSPVEEEARISFRRSIVAARRISAGETITENMLSYKRPGNGLKPYQRGLVIGRRSAGVIEANEKLSLEALTE